LDLSHTSADGIMWLVVRFGDVGNEICRREREKLGMRASADAAEDRQGIMRNVPSRQPDTIEIAGEILVVDRAHDKTAGGKPRVAYD